VAGHVTGGIEAWTEAGLPVAHHEVIPSNELQERLAAKDDLCVLDVRTDGEWAQGHIPGAIHIVLPDLPNKIEQLRDHETLVTICGGGYRSAIAASLLERSGFTVLDQLGGMAAWNRDGCTTTKDAACL
jgi:hydroxyacylglutathione hydrolase